MNNNQDNVFYYFKDKTNINSKLITLEYEKIKKENSCLYYYDLQYDAINWKSEPKESLQTHYKNQAQRIRDNFDYIILCYSGGIDSTNILETFYYNGIKLDKIITLGALSQDSFEGDDTNHNGEVYYNVFPYIKQLGLENIFELIDYTKKFYSISNFLHINNSWVEECGSWFSPHHWIWKNIHEYIVPNFYKNKKVAIIFGRDKPMLHTENNKYYFVFNDSMINNYYFYTGKDNIDVINFYWDPNYPYILIKQLHIIKKFIEFNKTVNLAFDYNRVVQTISGVSIHSLIYDLKNPLCFIGKKSSNSILSIRDSYLKNKTNCDIYHKYKLGIKQVYSRLGSINIPTRFSKRYYIS